MKLQIIVTALFCILLLGNCCEEITGPLDVKKTWTPVPGLEEHDIKYMLQNNGILYVAAVEGHIEGWQKIGQGIIFKSEDGINFEKIFSCPKYLGPMTSRDDSIYVLCEDSIYYYTPALGWKGKWSTPPLLSYVLNVGDIVFYKDEFYGMTCEANHTIKIYNDGSYEEIYPSGYRSAGYKFFKYFPHGEEKVYVRIGFYPPANQSVKEFDGEHFHDIPNGLPEDMDGTFSGLYSHGDTLFATFSNPDIIYYMLDNQWNSYTNTLPQSKCRDYFKPPLNNQPIAMTFVNNRLFIATSLLGVLEWLGNNKWKIYSEGLPQSLNVDWEDNDTIEPVIFIQYYKGYLFAGLGSPYYERWTRHSFGLYYHKLE